jgi:hypothetical protein
LLMIHLLIRIIHFIIVSLSLQLISTTFIRGRLSEAGLGGASLSGARRRGRSQCELYRQFTA